MLSNTSVHTSAHISREKSRTGIFITGTDSGVGKTHIGTRLAAHCLSQGLRVQPRKPVESGCVPDHSGNLIPADGLAYYAATGRNIALHSISPFRLKHALSPARASILENMHFTIDNLHQAVLNHTTATDFLLVEGAGGFHSPLAADGLNSDLATQLQLPILIVAQNRLGCINHTLLTLAAIYSKGLTPLAIVLNQTTATHDPSGQYNHDDLCKLCNIPVITNTWHNTPTEIPCCDTLFKLITLATPRQA